MADELPDLKTLTAAQANRLVCADYLRQMALLVESGALEAFDLVWGLKHDKLAGKPHGKIVLESGFVQTPVETELLNRLDEANAVKSNKIDFTDLSKIS